MTTSPTQTDVDASPESLRAESEALLTQAADLERAAQAVIDERRATFHATRARLAAQAFDEALDDQAQARSRMAAAEDSIRQAILADPVWRAVVERRRLELDFYGTRLGDLAANTAGARTWPLPDGSSRSTFDSDTPALPSLTEVLTRALDSIALTDHRPSVADLSEAAAAECGYDWSGDPISPTG